MILPGVEKIKIRDMEWRLLELLDFNTSIKPSLYAKYYFDLRQLFFDIVGKLIIYYILFSNIYYCNDNVLFIIFK